MKEMKKQIILSGILLFLFQCFSLAQGSAYSGKYTDSAPIVLDGKSNQTISMLSINNPSGHCIKLANCSNIIIQNCKLGPAKNEGVYLYNCKNITITNCSMDSIDSGVVADACTGIVVTYNDVRNVQGPMPRGQMVQFGHVYGAGNSISYNVGENILGQSFPEDEISLYMSNGTAADPIKVIGNWIRGGGPSGSGGGIMTGDQGGSYVLVQDNILVNPGQYGITISSGNNITIKNNKIYSMKQSISNIGLSAFKQYPINSFSNTIMNNEVNFTNKDGVLNNMWNAGNMGEVIGWVTNSYNANLNSSILPVQIIGRAKGTTTSTVVTPTTSNYKIFPNPVFSHSITITSVAPNNQKIAIFNIKGQKIIDQSINNSKTEIDTSNLTAGVYVVKISDNDNVIEIRKIIVGKI